MGKDVQIIISAKDLASGVFNNLTGNLEKAESKAEKFGNRLSTIGGHLAGLSLTIATAGGAAVKMAADMEVTEVAFTTLLGSVDAAKKHLEDLKKFAAATPFQFTELTTASRRMLALGFSANQVVPILRILGDTSSSLGLGAEGLNRIILALGQMKAKGAASGEEMKQLAEAGIPAWDLLAKKIGVTIPEAMKLVEKKAIDSGTAVSAVLMGLANDPRFSGGMEKQMSTLSGIWSNFKDTMSFTLADIGGLIVQTFDLKDRLNGLTQGLKDFSDWFKNLNPSIRAAIVDVGLFTAVLGPFLIIIGKTAQGVSAIISLLKMLSTIGVVTTITNYTNALSAAAAGNTAAASSITFMNNAMLGSLVTAASLTAVLLSLKVAYDSFQDLNLHTSKVNDFSKITDFGQATKIKSDLEREIKRLEDARNKSFSWDKEGIKLYNQEIEDLTKKLNAVKAVITKLSNPNGMTTSNVKVNCPLCGTPLQNGKCPNKDCLINGNGLLGGGETAKKASDIVTELSKSLAKNEQQLRLQGQAFNKSEADANAYLHAILSLTEIDPKNKNIAKWAEIYKQLINVKSIDDIVKQLNADFDATTAAIQRLGDADEDINVIEFGFRNIDEALKNVIDDLDIAQSALQKFAEADEDLNLLEYGFRNIDDAIKATLDDLEKYNDAMDKLKIANAEVSLLNGEIPYDQAENARKMISDALKEGENLAEGYSDSWGNAMFETLREWDNTSRQMMDIAESTANGMQQSFSDFFFDAFTHQLKSLNDYWLQFRNSLLRSISDMFSQQLTKKVMEGGLGDLLGGLVGQMTGQKSTDQKNPENTQQASGGIMKGLQGIMNSTIGKFGLGALMGGGGMGSILGSGLGLLFPWLGPMGGGLLGGLFDSLFGGGLQKITVQANSGDFHIDFAEANFKSVKLPVSYAGKGVPDFNATAPVSTTGGGDIHLHFYGSVKTEREAAEMMKTAAVAAFDEKEKEKTKWQRIKYQTAGAY